MTFAVEGLKAHLNLVGDEDNALLVGKIAAASAWIVSYCGLATMPDDMPGDLSEAVHQLAAHLYAHRGDDPESGTIPATVKALVAPYYRWSF